MASSSSSFILRVSLYDLSCKIAEHFVVVVVVVVCMYVFVCVCACVRACVCVLCCV